MLFSYGTVDTLVFKIERHRSFLFSHYRFNISRFYSNNIPSVTGSNTDHRSVDEN